MLIFYNQIIFITRKMFLTDKACRKVVPSSFNWKTFVLKLQKEFTLPLKSQAITIHELISHYKLILIVKYCLNLPIKNSKDYFGVRELTT